MTFEIRINAAEFLQICHRKQSGFRPRGVKNRSGVAFGKNEAVVVVIFRVLRVVAHVAVEQRGHQIGHRTARSWMTTTSRCRGGN
jgi:hypothetical protein